MVTLFTLFPSGTNQNWILSTPQDQRVFAVYSLARGEQIHAMLTKKPLPQIWWTMVPVEGLISIFTGNVYKTGSFTLERALNDCWRYLSEEDLAIFSTEDSLAGSAYPPAVQELEQEYVRLFLEKREETTPEPSLGLDALVQALKGKINGNHGR